MTQFNERVYNEFVTVLTLQALIRNPVSEESLKFNVTNFIFIVYYPNIDNLFDQNSISNHYSKQQLYLLNYLASLKPLQVSAMFHKTFDEYLIQLTTFHLISLQYKLTCPLLIYYISLNIAIIELFYRMYQGKKINLLYLILTSYLIYHSILFPLHISHYIFKLLV